MPAARAAGEKLPAGAERDDGERAALIGDQGPSGPALQRLPAAIGLAAFVLVLGAASLCHCGGLGCTGGLPDCSDSQYCENPHTVCFAKDGGYAACKESCITTDWSCEPLSNNGSAPIGKAVSLRSAHGKYVVANRFNDTIHLQADRGVADDWGTFVVGEIKDHKVALRSNHTTYVTCNLDGALPAEAASIQEWEEIIWVDNSDGTVSLLCGHTGKYLRATPDGSLKADASVIDSWEKFTWTQVRKPSAPTACSQHEGAPDCSHSRPDDPRSQEAGSEPRAPQKPIALTTNSQEA